MDNGGLFSTRVLDRERDSDHDTDRNQPQR